MGKKLLSFSFSLSFKLTCTYLTTREGTSSNAFGYLLPPETTNLKRFGSDSQSSGISEWRGTASGEATKPILQSAAIIRFASSSPNCPDSTASTNSEPEGSVTRARLVESEFYTKTSISGATGQLERVSTGCPVTGGGGVSISSSPIHDIEQTTVHAHDANEEASPKHGCSKRIARPENQGRGRALTSFQAQPSRPPAVDLLARATSCKSRPVIRGKSNKIFLRQKVTDEIKKTI